MPTGKIDGINFFHLPGHPHNTMCLEEAGVAEADAIIIGPADDLNSKEVGSCLAINCIPSMDGPFYKWNGAEASLTKRGWRGVGLGGKAGGGGIFIRLADGTQFHGGRRLVHNDRLICSFPLPVICFGFSPNDTHHRWWVGGGTPTVQASPNPPFLAELASQMP